MLGIRPGEAVVHIGAHVLPLGVRLDHVPVGVLLHLNRDQLIDVVRGDSAVRRNAEDAIFLRRSCRSSDLPDVLARIGVDLHAQGFLGAGALGHEACSRRSLRFLLSSPGAFLGPRTNVFQGSVHSCLCVFHRTRSVPLEGQTGGSVI